MTFKRKLVLYSILISTIPVFIVGWLATSIASRSIQEEVEANQQMLLRQIEYRLDQLFNNLNTQAVLLTLNPVVLKSVETGPREKSNVVESMALVEALKNQSNLSPIRYDIELVYRKHDYVYSTVNKSIPFKDSSYDRILRNMPINRNAPIIVPPGRFDNRKLILMRPVPYSSYYTEGMIALNVDQQELSDLLTSGDTAPNYKSRVWIVDASGRVIVSNSGERTGSQLFTSSEVYQFWKNPGEGNSVYTLTGDKHKLSALKVTRFDWTILTMTPMSELSKKSDRIQYLTWITVAILTMLWVLVAFAGTHHIYAPIERLLSRVPSDFRKAKQSDKGLAALEQFLNDMMHDNQKLKRQFTEHLPHLQEHMSRHLLWGDWTENEIHQKAKQLNLSLTGTHYRVVLAAIDNLSHFMNGYEARDQSLMQYAFRKMVEEICGNAYTSTTFTPQPGQVAVILGEHRAEDRNDEDILLDTAMEIRRAVRTYCKFTVSVCISGSRSDLTGIRNCYSEALELLHYRMLLGPDKTITEHMLEPSIMKFSREIIDNQKRMLSHLIEGQPEAAEHYLQQLTEQMGSTVDHPETVRGIFSHFLIELDVRLNELGYHLQSMFPDNLHTRLNQCGTVTEIRNWLSDEVFVRIDTALKEARVSNHDKAVMSALQSIEESWDADFMAIADQYDISVPHLSRAFKEKTGEKFSDYVIRTRMNKAKEWLAHTKMPIAEIAEKLHYSNAQNFNRTFKQFTGTTPGKYRHQLQESE